MAGTVLVLRWTSRGLAVVLVVALAAVLLTASVSAAPSRVSLARILTGYSRPVLVTHAGGDSRVIFIVEQTGKIKRATYQAGRWKRLGTFLDLTSRVNDPRASGNDERGLSRLAIRG